MNKDYQTAIANWLFIREAIQIIFCYTCWS